MATDVIRSGISPELDLITVIRPVLRSLIVAHTFLTLLIPLSLMVLHYSTPHTRRQPIFILNVVILLVAFSFGTIVDAVGISTILVPLTPVPLTLYITISAIGIFQSMLADVGLLMRLIVVYPLSQIGPRRFLGVTLLPVLLKLVRVVNVSIFLKTSSSIPANGTNNYNAHFTSPYLKVEWTAQIVDNAYATIMFLLSIRGRGPVGKNTGDSFIPMQPTFAYRLWTLFRIALSNFVIPTLLSIALLVVSFHDVDGYHVGDAVYVNCMISTFGVIFATAWVGKEGRRIVKERKQSVSLEFYNMNRSMGNAPGEGTQNLAAGPPSFFTDVMTAMVDVGHHGLGNVKQDSSNVDLEARYKIAPFVKWEG